MNKPDSPSILEPQQFTRGAASDSDSFDSDSFDSDSFDSVHGNEACTVLSGPRSSDHMSLELSRLPMQIVHGAALLLVPVLFLRAPLKLSLPLLVLSVMAYVVLPPILRKICPVLQELVEKTLFVGSERTPWLKCLTDFVTHMKPFVLWGMFLVWPLAVLMMLAHSARKLLGLTAKQPFITMNPSGAVSLRIRQNFALEAENQDDNFMSTSIFTITAATLFLSGIPAAVTFAFYSFLGIDRILGFPSTNPEFIKVFCGILLYAYSVGWCLSTLFFKAYFTYPLTFTSKERYLDLDQIGLRTTHIKGWFSQVIWSTAPEYWPRELAWKDVRSIEYAQDGIGGMSPLPDTVLSKNSSLYQVLNKFATFTDAFIARQKKQANYINVLEFPSSDHALGRSIRINLWELNAEERAKLYYSCRYWAPQAVISDDAARNLIGSTNLKNSRFTKIWFELLNADMGSVKDRKGTLAAGSTLQNGRFTVIESVGLIESAVSNANSTGYSNLYSNLHSSLHSNLYRSLDSDQSQKEVMLKEYILVSGNGLKALAESATRFENECAVLSELADSGMSPVNMFVEKQRVYVVQENINGTSLRALVEENGAMTESEVLPLALQMCDLLKNLHQRLSVPVLHRDFTPDNLFINDEGRLYLTDFSFSKRLDSATNLADECGGRPSYTAPEQFRGVLTVQSDLYALGATLYFLLAGYDPLPITILSLRDGGFEVDPTLDAVIGKATELELSLRYESAEWLEIDLKSVISGRTPLVSPLIG